MKTTFATCLGLVFATISLPAEQAGPATAPCKQCHPPAGRAALMLGGKTATPQSTFVVTGMTGTGCSGKVTTALAEIDGVTVDSVCHHSGHAIVARDPAKVKSADIVAAINATGFRASGELVRFRIPAMIHEAGAATVEKSLEQIEGVTTIETTVTPSMGTATVVFDPSMTDKARVEAAINATNFKVATGR